MIQFEPRMLIVFQLFLFLNEYAKKISKFTLITELKLMALFVLSNTNTFYILFDGFSVGYRNNCIIYV